MKRTAILRSHTGLRRLTPLRSRARRPRSSKILSPSYRRFICSLPCLIDDATSPCSGEVGPHHVGHYGQARQNDNNTVPLCAAHHLNGFGPHAIHRIHQAAFEARFGLSLSAWIARLNQAWECLTETQRRELAWNR
jgi:hypothetical protein